MAKSARTSGGKGETHYNKSERSTSAGRDSGGAGDRPSREGRSERGESKPYERKPAGDKKPYRKSGGEDKPYERKGREEGDRDRKPYARKPEGDRPYAKKEGGERKPFERREEGDKKPYRGGERTERGATGGRTERGAGGDRPFRKSAGEGKPFRGERDDRKPFRKESDKPFRSREEGSERPKRTGPRKEEGTGTEGTGERRARKPIPRKTAGAAPARKRPFGDKKPFDRKGAKPMGKKRTDFDKEEFAEHSNPTKPGKWETDAKQGPMTLNKYLAHSGVSSRRDAANIIKEGKVEVNGVVLKEPGYRVQPGDKVIMDGMVMKPQTHFVYVLLNKPKDFLTTTEDDRGRRTVMELVTGATEDRLYPIGRLDRNTTGVLLLTNDGDLAQRLSHPRYESKKIYQVTLDKDVTKKDFDQIMEGVVLEDGPAKVDRLAYLENKNEIGLEIHTGRNRIVRRIFESLGYEVEKLDRVMYAGLTKKNVGRGKWRFLTEKEVIMLKHFKS